VVHRTVGIHDKYDERRVVLQVLTGKIQCEALPASVRIVPLDHMNSDTAADVCRAVQTVVCHKKYPGSVTAGELKRG
jgi:hypothetical protein